MTAKFMWFDQTYITDPIFPYAAVKRDQWWVVNNENQILLYKGINGQMYPQCNPNREVVMTLMSNIPDAVNAVYIPLAFAPIRIEDY